MISKHMLLAVLLILPVSLHAENVMEMRYVLSQEETGAIKREVDAEPVWLSSEVVISDADVAEATLVKANEPWSVLVKLTPGAAERFDAQAAKHFSQRLAIVVRGKVISAPVIQARQFGGTLQISGNFKQQDAEDLVKALQPKEKP